MAQRKILIAVDGSSPANMAFKWYLDNLYREKDEVIVAHVAEYDLKIGLPGAAVDVEAVTQAAKKENDRIEGMINGYVDQLRPLNVKAQSKVEVGSQRPGEAIIKIAEETGASAIIVGSRGLGKIRRTLLGSVSEYIIHHAPPHCVVTIMRDS